VSTLSCIAFSTDALSMSVQLPDGAAVGAAASATGDAVESAASATGDASESGAAEPLASVAGASEASPLEAGASDAALPTLVWFWALLPESPCEHAPRRQSAARMHARVAIARIDFMT
jgi:hypothetical protein